MKATGNKSGKGEGRDIQISMAIEAKVTGAMLVHKSLYLRSPDCYERKDGWEETVLEPSRGPLTHLNRIEGRVMVSCS